MKTGKAVRDTCIRYERSRMASDMHRARSCITGLALLLFLCGCTGMEKIDTAADLAAALQRGGLDYATQGPAKLPKMKYGRIDEGITLAGDGLSVDIVRIEDERTYKAFLGAGAILGAAEAKTGQRLPQRPDLYSKSPFVIIVREEPSPGEVKQILEAVLGSE